MLAEIIWNEDTLVPLMIFSVPIIAILAGAWVQVERRRSDNELKRTMIERGMSIDEIERVLNARANKK